MILHSNFGRYLELVISIQQRTGDYLQIISLGLHRRCNFSPKVQQSMSFYEICMSLLCFLVLLSWLEPHASGGLQVLPGTMRFEHTTLFSKNLNIHSMLGILVDQIFWKYIIDPLTPWNGTLQELLVVIAFEAKLIYFPFQCCWVKYQTSKIWAKFENVI